MPISPTTFRRAFERFQAIHRANCGFPLDTFRNHRSFAFRSEDYKDGIAFEANRRLDAAHWSRAQIGTGQILDRVISSIEIPKNNLLYWQPKKGPSSRVHSRLYEARSESTTRRQAEEVFYTLYKQGTAGQAQFDALVSICGRRYELLAYLFFAANRCAFLPIRTTYFDKVLAELGVDLRTQGQCSWQNYQDFLALMQEVKTRLQAEGIPDPTLLDAHSFSWILARIRGATPSPHPRPAARGQLFTGIINPAGQQGQFIPNDDALPTDMEAVARNRVASGQVAEETAKQHEQDRLRSAGHGDLAEEVVIVSNRPGLGYDLKSFEADGTARFIEVKNVSNDSRFFLSDWEWRNSQGRSNYWFYLVREAGTGPATVTYLSATQLRREQLQPTEYRVTFTP